MQELAPGGFDVAAGDEPRERLAHHGVGVRDVEAGEAGQDLELRQAAEERGDQWLNGNQGAVAGPGVAPRFQKVRRGEMPVAGELQV